MNPETPQSMQPDRSDETPEQRDQRVQAVQQAVRDGRYDETTAAEHAAQAIIDHIDN